MERNIALRLSYTGTAYHGWQVQKNAVSVAEALEKALSSVVCHPVKVTGAGRTDAGVHAETYVANFRTESRIPVDEVIDAMGEVGRRLPVELRETALGGLAATPTGRAVKERMASSKKKQRVLTIKDARWKLEKES